MTLGQREVEVTKVEFCLGQAAWYRADWNRRRAPGQAGDVRAEQELQVW